MPIPSLLNLYPSEIRWIEEHAVYESYRIELFEAMCRMLARDYNDVAQLDTVYCSGMQLHKAFSLLTLEERGAIEGIGTRPALVFMQAIKGLTFNPDNI